MKAILFMADAQGLVGPVICWGSVAIVFFYIWYTSRLARERAEQQAAEKQAQEQAFAARMKEAWAAQQALEEKERAAQQARRDAEKAAHQELLAVHDRAVAELMTRIAQGARVASPALVAMLPMKKNEEAFYATRAHARTARGPSEAGHLIITNQRVHWNYANDRRQDILKTWRSVARWYSEGSEKLVIEWGSGTPLVLLFSVPEGGPEHDARLACELMNRASETTEE